MHRWVGKCIEDLEGQVAVITGGARGARAQHGPSTCEVESQDRSAQHASGGQGQRSNGPSSLGVESLGVVAEDITVTAASLRPLLKSVARSGRRAF